MKKLFLILLACLCMVGCSSGGTPTDGSAQGETSGETKSFPYKVDGDKFEITGSDMWIIDGNEGQKMVVLNLTLKNDTDETYESLKVDFTVFNGKDEVQATSFDYENLEPEQETQAKSWILPVVVDKKDKTWHGINEDDFTHIEVTGIEIGDDKTEFETPITIKKEDMTRSEEETK